MKIIQLRCPSCGSALEAEDGLEVFYCRYCGQKIILSEQTPAALNAKVAIKRMSHEEQLQLNDLDYRTRIFKLKQEEKRRKDKEILIITAVSIGLLFLFPLFCILMDHLGG